jgi:hypothetical protein
MDCPDVSQLGPLPNMYENTWQVPGKLLSAWAEGAAVVLSGLGLLMQRGVPEAFAPLPVHRVLRPASRHDRPGTRGR